MIMWMSHEIYAGFAKRLILLCNDKNLPERGRQADLARLCGVKPSSVNKWFNAVSLPDATNLMTIAEWGKTTVDWLLSGKTQKTEEYLQDERINHIIKIMQNMPDYKVDQAVSIIDTIAQPAPSNGTNHR